MDKRIIYIISGIIFLIIFIALIIWNNNNNKKNPVKIDKDSFDRLTELNYIFSSILGEHWSYILFLFAIILIIFFYTIYMLSIQGINININDNNSKLFTILFIIFLILFVISIIILTIRSVQTQNIDNKYCTNNYIPQQDDSKQNSQTLQIIGLSLFILISLLLSIYYFFIRKKVNM
jgi:amino acid transporter